MTTIATMFTCLSAALYLALPGAGDGHGNDHGWATRRQSAFYNRMSDAGALFVLGILFGIAVGGVAVIAALVNAVRAVVVRLLF